MLIVVIQPEFTCTQSGRVVHRRHTGNADDGCVDLTYEVHFVSVKNCVSLCFYVLSFFNCYNLLFCHGYVVQLNLYTF